MKSTTVHRALTTRSNGRMILTAHGIQDPHRQQQRVGKPRKCNKRPDPVNVEDLHPSECGRDKS
jgi:hypothetical protein